MNNKIKIWTALCELSVQLLLGLVMTIKISVIKEAWT